MKPDMANGDYAAAFRTFITTSDSFITQARAGTPFDVGTQPHKPLSAGHLALAIGLGFVIAFVVVGSWKGQLKSVRAQKTAESYVRAGSMAVTQSRDFFLYREVSRTKKAKESSGSDSGGSSTHTSSSGTTHGGGGGSF